MAGTTEGKIRVEQIEGLEEFLKGFFQQQWGIMIQPLVQDMEELKKSPAGTMIRLEETTNFLRGGLERLEDAIEELRGVQMRMLERMATKEELQALTGRVEQLAAQMATKEELQRLAERVVTKEEWQQTSERIARLEERMMTRFDQYEKRFALMQWTMAAIFPFLIGIIVKMIIG